jgi:hypothetical protein
MKMKLMALAVGAALALPISALAQDKHSSGSTSASAGASGGADSPRTQEGREANSATFKHLDLNNDGHISEAEMKGGGLNAQDFARLDKDRDILPGVPRHQVVREQRGTPGLLSYQEFSELNVGSASVGSGVGGAGGASGASGEAATPAPRQ